MLVGTASGHFGSGAYVGGGGSPAWMAVPPTKHSATSKPSVQAAHWVRQSLECSGSLGDGGGGGDGGGEAAGSSKRRRTAENGAGSDGAGKWEETSSELGNGSGKRAQNATGACVSFIRV